MKHIFLLVLCLMVLGCSTDSDSNNDEPNSQMLIKSITLNGEPWIDYSYNANDKLSEVILYVFGWIEVYEYTNDTTKIYIELQDGTLQLNKKYFWMNDLQLRRERFNSAGNLDDYRIYTFDNGNCSFVKNEYWNPEFSHYRKIDITYIDANCSWESVTTDENNNLTDSHEVVLDGKNRANKSALIAPFPDSLIGNRISLIEKDAFGVTRASESYNSEYTYNEFDYPTSEVRTYLDGTVETYVFEYN